MGGTFSESMERALSRFRNNTLTLIQHGALVGAVALGTTPALPGCGTNEVSGNDPNQNSNFGKADWYNDQGKRDTSMVSYAQSFWSVESDCERYCLTTTVFIKVQVKPALGANLDNKRVGVVWNAPGGSGTQTTVGTYFSTLANGMEEWHIPVVFGFTKPDLLMITAWYQDGLGNTFFDDNQGELHPIPYQGDYAVLRQDWTQTAIGLDPSGVKGLLSVFVADLDYSKVLEVIYTTDDWKTTQVAGIGSKGVDNTLYFVEDPYSGFERWHMDVNLPGSFTKFQYAIHYRQGVVNGAVPHDFWDSNAGQNYVVTGPIAMR